MEVNADFTARAVVHAAELPWVPSPSPGVERRMLDRLGGEVARATSIVRYAPGSRFPTHVHGGGEEFLVLDGVFSDETGDMPAGTYVRNPVGTEHAPSSVPGCTIFVKLWQFDPSDRSPVRVDTRALRFADGEGRAGVETASLHGHRAEKVRLERWAPGARVRLPLPGGGEFLVLGGGFEQVGERCGLMSWLRLPSGSELEAIAGPQGCRLWVKTGHLAGRFVAPDPT